MMTTREESRKDVIEIMAAHDLSARDLADLVGVGVQTARSWVERGAKSSAVQQLLARCVSKRGIAALRRASVECERMSQDEAMLKAQHLRVSLGLSLREMAQVMSTSQSSVRSWEHRLCDGPVRRLYVMLHDSKSLKRDAAKIVANRVPKNNAWSEAHIKLVRMMVVGGSPIAEIASAVGRSENAVRSRMSRMGISLSGGVPPLAP